MKHYRCSRYFIDHTRAIRIFNTAKLLPSHCKMPSILEDDNTVLAAEEIMKSINEKLDAEGIITHKKVIQQLTCIITNKPPQRVTTQSPQRVTPTSTSVDITAPRIIKTSKRIHQRKTRSNTPMPTIIENKELILQEFEDTVMSAEMEKDIHTIKKHIT